MIVSESLVFTVDPVTSFLAAFGDSSRPDEALRQTAKQIQSEGGDIHPQSPASKLAQIVQQEVDNFCRLNPNFPPPRNPPQPRATLLILDRSIDPVAPLLHEFTYQAMINDLLPVQETDNHVGIKYTYEFHQADGTLGSQEVTLDEEDNVYKSIRHMHIAQCSDYLIEKFNEFLSENKSSNEPKTTAKSLKEMKDKLTNLPQYQDMKSKYSAHLSIAQECMSYFERHKLNSVGNLEQNMATGETADGEIPKTIVLDMVPLLDDPHISPVDKARLLMLYIIWKEGGIFEDDKRKLMEHAKLKGELRDAINNLPLIGVKLTRVRRQEKSSFIKKRRERHRRNKDEEQPYELSRYVPVVKKIMETHFSSALEAKQFGYTRQSDMDPVEETSSPGSLPASGVSLRSTKPTWAKKNNPGSPRPSNGAKLIIFIVGGATYSEIRSVYEVAEAYHRDVFIGTTELLRPAAFVEHLSNLRRPVPTPTALIAPYVPPQKPVEVSKATSLMSHMHIGSSPQLSSKSSSLSLSTIASDTKSSVMTEEKKKKKGLKRLFG
ncbi:Sec1-like protein [Rhizopus microsporus var. microsporus]|uniref:Sec1-like protein n=1 Tax=Rhizopus microsporus var. microsporus TaxID=86635 RepID=A0A1X0RHJ0_RHIZD|nr:Sec1-like protein [Rhizopus microsporus var. microsporus]